MRIGQGLDAHRFAPGRQLMLGGVEIPHDQGLAAHSDGDVVIHALCDALLGAAALGDIGRHFPDTSAAYRDIDSRVLLREVASRLKEQGFVVINADLTVIAQRPRLAGHIDAMRRTLASDLETSEEFISIKATSTDGMGFTGRGEGIAALAVVLLDESREGPGPLT